MKDDMMKKALQMRRGQGIDIRIMMEDPEAAEKQTDLAPKAEAPEMDGEMQGEMTEMPMDDMSETDKVDLMGRKPRSLGDRARQAALMSAQKK